MDTLLQPKASIRGKRLIKVNSLESPKIVSFFSSEELSKTKTTIRLDASHCKYFKKHLLGQDNPQINLKSYVDFIKKSKRKSFKKQPMVSFLLYLEKLISRDSFTKFSAGKLFEADIICCVNILIEMMMVHGDDRQSFTLLATKYKGNIYLKQRSNKPKARSTISATVRHVLFAEHPNTDVNSTHPFAAKFHCVSNFKLRNASVMFSSCLQGVKSDVDITSHTNPCNIEAVITKTKVNKRNGRNPKKYESYGTPHWWCHSYLLGNADVHVVNVDDKDKVNRINTFDIDAILCEYEKRWKKSSDERISFLSLLFDLIKSRMTFVNCPYTVYEFYHNGEGTIHYNVHSGRSEFTFLSDQYINATKDF